MAEQYIGEAVIGLIILMIGYVIKNSLMGVDTKLDIVLKNQEDHRVQMAEIKKDVESNKDYGRDHKVKIEKLTAKVNDLETLTAQHKEYIENQKNSR